MKQTTSGTTLGFTIEKESPDEIIARRVSRESNIRVRLWDAERDPQLKEKIGTRYDFFNHMLETLAWHACLNVEVEAVSEAYELTHVICEDTGWSLGGAFLRLFQQRIARGVQGDGYGLALMDEASCRCILSFEGRARCQMHWSVPMPDTVEDISSHHLVAFWEGLAYGGAITIQLDILSGKDPHHTWEAAFRCLGKSLQMALADCPWRAGTTPGVKGL